MSTNRNKRRWYYDPTITYHNTLRPSVVVALFILTVTFLIIGICVCVNYGERQGCQDKAAAYKLDNPNYSFWAGTCFVDLPSGQTVNIDNVQENSQGETIYTPDLKRLGK